MGKPRRLSSASSRLGVTAPRIERKIIEKKRRLQMKSLYSDLISLIPDHESKVEGLPLPDQIDEAVEYIKFLKKKLEKMRQKKESLMLSRNRSQNFYCSTSENNQATNYKRSPPLVEIHDMGPNFDLILANGLQDYSQFYDIIRLLHQHGVEVAGASFSGDGTSTIQVLQDKGCEYNTFDKHSWNRIKDEISIGIEDQSAKPDEKFEDATILSRKLKELVSGTSSSEVVGSQLNLWDYEIDSDIWGFDIPSGIQYYYEEFCM